MQKKIFWVVFAILGLLADFLLPFWWAFGATIPILFSMVDCLPQRLVLIRVENQTEIAFLG